MPDFVGSLRPPRLSVAPASPALGELYFDTGTNKLYWWDGTSWISATGSGGGGGSTTQMELDYVQSISPSAAINATTEGAAVAVLTTPGATYDGGKIKVGFFCPRVSWSGSGFCDLVFYRDSTIIGQVRLNEAGNATQPFAGHFYEVMDTPSAGSHTYKVSAFVTASAVTFQAGPGGSGNLVAMYLRTSRATAVGATGPQGPAGSDNGVVYTVTPAPPGSTMTITGAALLTETTLFDQPIGAGVLGLNKTLQVKIFMSFDPNNPGSGNIFTIRIYFGGTKYFDLTLPNMPNTTGVRPVTWTFDIMNKGVANSQKLNGTFQAEFGSASIANPTTGEGTTSNAWVNRNIGASMTEDTSLTKNLKVTIQGNANNVQKVLFDGAVMKVIG